MAEWWVYAGASGGNDGTSLADAYTDPNSGTYAAGDTIYICGNFNLVWTMASGGNADNPINVVGCDTSGTPYGAGNPAGSGGVAYFDGESTRANGISVLTYDYYVWRNIGCKNCTGVGWLATSYQTGHMFFDCDFSSNGASGLSGITGGYIFRCKFTNNTTYGITAVFDMLVDQCFFSNNGTADILTITAFVNISNSVFVGSPTGVVPIVSTCITKCFFYNQSTVAISNTNNQVSVTFCLFHSCNRNYADGAVNDLTIWDNNYSYNPSNADTVKGKKVTQIATVDLVDDPCTDATEGDFSLVSGTSARDIGIYYNAANSSFMSVGALEPEPEFPPTITDLAPPSGVAGTQIVITGGHFSAAQGAGTVTVGGSAVSSYDAWSDTELTVTIDAGLSPGGQDVVVTNNAGDSVTAPNGFYVTSEPSPTITDVTPSSGSAGSQITITGTNFGSSRGSGSVYTNTTEVNVYGSWSDTEIVVTTSSLLTTGAKDIIVTNDSGGEVISPNGFVVSAALLTIDSVTPTAGPAGTELTISGNGFGTAGTSYIGSRAITESSRTDTTIIGTVDTEVSAGLYDLLVFNSVSDGCGVYSNAFTVQITSGSISDTTLYEADGPDGKTGSAVYFSDDTLSLNSLSVASGSIIFWYKNLDSLTFNSSPVTITSVGIYNGWTCGYAALNGSGDLMFTKTVGNDCYLFDIRIQNKTFTSSEYNYMFNDIKYNDGNSICPMV